MYKEICGEAIGERTDYFLHWFHSKPLVVTSRRREELRYVHRCLLKCLHYLGEHYKEYVEDWIRLSDKEKEILEYQSKYPYRLGAYRPDYLISNKGEIKLVEITSRFFSHGIWLSYYANVAADRYISQFPGESRECRYEALSKNMAELIPDGKPVFILKSSDKTCELILYKSFYEHLGHTVTVYEADKVEPNIEKWSKGFVISALNMDDINSFSIETVRTMIDARMVNDFRTILLAHDKRFLALIFEDEFTDKCLRKEDTVFLRKHTIETFLPNHHLDKWQDAIINKDKYIIKPCRLGKSEGVYAGTMTSEEVWQSLFRNENIGDMILQPFMDQRTFPLTWEGHKYNEYICGSMLTLNDEYFDSGLVRTSSAPVTNKVDDRKMFVVESDSENMIKGGIVL